MTTRLMIDPTRCDGVGICAIKAPDLITLDAWGFPMIAESPLTEKTLVQAQRAVAACPKRALMIIEEPPAASG